MQKKLEGEKLSRDDRVKKKKCLTSTVVKRLKEDRKGIDQ